jgi:hypothetical protein
MAGCWDEQVETNDAGHHGRDRQDHLDPVGAFLETTSTL